jgi:hypothetical protein
LKVKTMHLKSHPRITLSPLERGHLAFSGQGKKHIGWALSSLELGVIWRARAVWMSF